MCMFAKFERDALKYISRYCHRWVSTNYVMQSNFLER